MPRKPSVRYFPSRHAFYCQIDKVQHWLADGPDDSPGGENHTRALRAFLRLLEDKAADEAGDENTVRALFDRYMAHIRARRSPGTVSIRERSAKAFVEEFGKVRVSELKQSHVTAFCDGRRSIRPTGKQAEDGKWGTSTEAMCVDSVCAALRWAKKERLILSNPLEGMERPIKRSRGREALVSEELHARAMAAASVKLREVLEALKATGARPSEITHATAKAFNPEIGALVYFADQYRKQGEHRHKTAGKRKDRVIFFTGSALETVRSLVSRYPEGPIFRTRRENPWTVHSLCLAFTALRKKIGAETLFPYCYRHTFATAWLLSGRSIETLADLLGNSPQTLRHHYAHLLGRPEELRKQLERFIREQEGGQGPAKGQPG